MHDPAAEAARWFLVLGGAVVLLAFGIPLLVAPLRWARLFRWRLPETSHLTTYLGRCTGALVVVNVLAAWRAALDPRAHRVVFEITIAVGVAMIAIHVVGWLRKEQPWTETVEIGFYVLFTGGASATYGWLFFA